VRHKIKAALVAVLLGLGLAATVATPAHAAWSDCGGTGVVWVAEHVDCGGARATIGWPIGECANFSSTWNNRISSVANRFVSSGGIITFWTGSYCTGWQWRRGPQTLTNVTSWPYADNFTSGCLGPVTSVQVGCGRYT
jgi:hypothetical protein